MTRKGKLELTWVNKDERPRLEPRILVEDKALSYGDPRARNMLIHGDNRLALKALEQDFAGEVQCIYIDPPFNTGQAFEHYDDGIEHSLWLSLMRDRLEILYGLLSTNGLLWVHLDDSEVHYCKVLLDEICTRSNFVAHITYERSGAAGLGLGGFVVNTGENILLYKKGELPARKVYGAQELEPKTMKRYNKALVDAGSRELVMEFVSKSNGLPVRLYKHAEFKIETVSLSKFEQRKDEIMADFVKHFDQLFRTNQIQKENEFQRDLVSRMDKRFLYTVDYTPSRGKHEGKEITLYYYNAELFAWLKDTAQLNDGRIVKFESITNVWTHAEIPKADIANEGGVNFPRGKKPEQLLRRIIDMSTEEDDIVLDSFAGSGTTAAVAHKMKRRWITIERGEQAQTHCLPRLQRVVDGSDPSGITAAVNWQGGGGFGFYRLAETLLIKDPDIGTFDTNPRYTREMLYEAICKLENFRYAPRGLWHGYSSEKRFIHITLEMLNQTALDRLEQELRPDDSLLIYYKKRASNLKCSDCIDLKRIPHDLQVKCDFEVGV
jgi:adenine-specific DNA-methyltransferase